MKNCTAWMCNLNYWKAEKQKHLKFWYCRKILRIKCVLEVMEKKFVRAIRRQVYRTRDKALTVVDLDDGEHGEG